MPRKCLFALEMLHTVIMKFPESVVEEHAESLFLPLVARLVNDNSNNVRAMVAIVLKVLMSRVGPRALQRMVDFSLTWYKGDNSCLWRPAAQVLGFLIEVMNDKFAKHVEEVLEATIIILRGTASKSEEEEEDNIPNWQEIYASMILIQKLLQQFPQYSLQSELQEFWELVCSLLLHKHSWIRLASGRLLGMYYVACGENNKHSSSKQLLHPSWLLLVAGYLCKQLDAEIMDSALADQTVKNLLYVSSAFPSLESAFQVTEPKSQKRIEQAKEILGANKRGLKNKTHDLDADDGVSEDGYRDLPAVSGNIDDQHSHGNAPFWHVGL